VKRRYTHFNFSGDTSTFFKLKAHLHSMINQCSVVDFLPASWSRCTYNSDTLRWAKRQLRISSPYNDGWQKRAEPAKNETLVIEKKQLSLGKQAKHQIRLYFSSVVSRSTNAAGGATADPVHREDRQSHSSRRRSRQVAKDRYSLIGQYH